MNDDILTAYFTGRLDGIAARRDQARATDPVTGPDYRTGFLDGRLEVFRLLSNIRRIVEENDW